MAAALRAAEGGYIFSKSSGGGGIFKIFPARGGIPPLPPLFPTPASDTWTMEPFRGRVDKTRSESTEVQFGFGQS